MKKIHISAILAALLLVSSVLYFHPSTPLDSVKIGTILGLTGSHAYYSEEALKGIRLAEKDIESEYDVDIDLVIEDTGGKANQAANAAIKLIEQDKVSSLITFSGASAALSVAPIANTKKIVQMELICYAPGCHTKDDYLFRVSGGAEVEPYFMADELLGRKVKDVYAIYAKNDFGLSMFTFFQEKFIAGGGNIVQSESFAQDESDFRSQIAKINSTKDTEYVVFVGFGEIKSFLKQGMELGMNLPVFAAQTAENPEVLKVAGVEGVKNLIYTYPGKTERTPYLNFKERYFKEYNIEPSYAAFKGYDALRVLYKALSQCTSHDSECIKSQLEKIKGYEGVSNVISFDEYGDISGEEFHIKRYPVNSFLNQ